MKYQPQGFRVVPPNVAPADDDPVSAYAALDDVLAALPASTELGSPILPCQQPCIEVTLTDEDNTPLAKVPYRLLLDGATLAEGTLDETGFVAIEEKELPPGDWNIEVALHRNESTQAVERADINLVGTLPEEAGQAMQAQIEEHVWLPFKPPAYPWGQ